MDTREQIISYLKKEIEEYRNENDELVDSGLLDSLKLMELISYIEDKYNIEIDIDDIDPESFNTVNSIVSLIEKNVSRKEK